MTHTHAHRRAARGLTLDVRLWTGVALNVLITAAEIVGGLSSGSLALLSDALHNASDVAALLLAIGARALGRKVPTGRFSYGFRRLEVVAALVNAAVLVGLAVLVGRAAVDRLRHPAAVDGHTMLAVALTAFGANVAAVFLLRRHEKHDLNVRGAFLHLVQDALASLVVVAAAVLAGTRLGPWLDPAASLLIGAAVVVSAGRLIWESVRILVEAAPLVSTSRSSRRVSMPPSTPPVFTTSTPGPSAPARWRSRLTSSWRAEASRKPRAGSRRSGDSSRNDGIFTT